MVLFPQATLQTLDKLREEMDQAKREQLSLQLSVRDSRAQAQNITYGLTGTFIPFVLIDTFVLEFHSKDEIPIFM